VNHKKIINQKIRGEEERKKGRSLPNGDYFGGNKQVWEQPAGQETGTSGKPPQELMEWGEHVNYNKAKKGHPRIFGKRKEGHQNRVTSVPRSTLPEKRVKGQRQRPEKRKKTAHTPRGMRQRSKLKKASTKERKPPTDSGKPNNQEANESHPEATKTIWGANTRDRHHVRWSLTGPLRGGKGFHFGRGGRASKLARLNLNEGGGLLRKRETNILNHKTPHYDNTSAGIKPRLVPGLRKSL